LDERIFCARKKSVRPTLASTARPGWHISGVTNVKLLVMIMKWHHINVHIQYIVEISFTELCCISQQASGSNKQAADVRHQTTDIRYYTSDIRLRNLLSGIRQGIEQQSLETRQRTSDIVLQVSVKTTGSRHQTTGSSQQTSDLRRQASAVAFLCGVACWLLPYACHMHDACV